MFDSQDFIIYLVELCAFILKYDTHVNKINRDGTGCIPTERKICCHDFQKPQLSKYSIPMSGFW